MKTPIIIIYVTFGYALIWHKAKLIIFQIEYHTVRIDGSNINNVIAQIVGNKVTKMSLIIKIVSLI